MNGKILTPAEYVQRHKDAFRCAFDYLNTHFPPGTDPDWWDQAGRDLSAASISQEENKLIINLLVGVYNYIEDEYKLRREKHGEA